MGSLKKPSPAILFVGILGSSPEILTLATNVLARRFGQICLESQIGPFCFTDYYTAEMGAPLRRKFVAFQQPFLPDRLAAVKIYTNRLEDKWRKENRRQVNLDPGYLTAAKVVLASTKDYAHRIYLSSGVYAEVTLLFQRKRWVFLPWTYPDYRSQPYLDFFTTLRTHILKTPTCERIPFSGNILRKAGLQIIRKK